MSDGLYSWKIGTLPPSASRSQGHGLESKRGDERKSFMRECLKREKTVSATGSNVGSA